jgi:hypothetical protein
MNKFEFMFQQQVVKTIDRELSRIHELLIYDPLDETLLAQKKKLQDHLLALSK